MQRASPELWLLCALLFAGSAAANDEDEPDEGLLEFLGEWAPGNLNSDDDVTTEDWLDHVEMTGPASAGGDDDNMARDGKEYE